MQGKLDENIAVSVAPSGASCDVCGKSVQGETCWMTRKDGKTRRRNACWTDRMCFHAGLVIEKETEKKSVCHVRGTNIDSGALKLSYRPSMKGPGWNLSMEAGADTLSRLYGTRKGYIVNKVIQNSSLDEETSELAKQALLQTATKEPHVQNLASGTKRRRPPSSSNRRTRMTSSNDIEQPSTPDQQRDESLGNRVVDSSRSNGQALTDFELAREERLRRNRELMLQLNLSTMAANLSSTSKPSNRSVRKEKGLGTRKSQSKESPGGQLPPRRSLRVQGLTAEGAEVLGIDQERRDGTVVLASGKVIHSKVLAPEVEKKQKQITGDIPLESVNQTSDIDQAFFASLVANSEHRESVKDEETMYSRFNPKNLHLEEHDVAKLVEDGTCHITWYPSASSMIVAAGDKKGHLGLWDINYSGEDRSEDSFDGVLLCKPHSDYISGLRWTSTGVSGLYSSSYDGSFRRMDATKMLFLEMYRSDSERFSAFDINVEKQCAYLADNNGGMTVVDLRTNKSVDRRDTLHEKRINSVSIEPVSEMYFTTTASAGENIVSVWDVRKWGKGKPMLVLPHSRASQGAYFSPSGTGEILTTSYDSRLRVWSDVRTGRATVKTQCYHDNNTGRWILPFRASWSTDGNSFLCGSMQRQLEFFDAKDGSLLARHSSEYLTAIPSRYSSHPVVPFVAAGTSSGRVHVFRSHRSRSTE